MRADALSAVEMAAAEIVDAASSAAEILLKLRVMTLSIGLRG
jgi:hypothetical protein